MKQIISIIALFCVSFASAQSKISVTGGADIVSAYIWRGTYNAGASIQPTLKGQLGGFSLSGWGSTDFIGENKKEVDLAVGYSFRGVSLSLTDYWWDGEGVYRYFNYKKHETSHRWEGGISYQLPVAKFPLIVSWNTMFAGSDFKADGSRAYSSYIELCYPFSAKGIDMNASLGAVPWYSPSILPSDNSRFSICNVAFGASKTLLLSDNISLPLFTRLIFNPAMNDVHFVFGLSLYFKS